MLNFIFLSHQDNYNILTGLAPQFQKLHQLEDKLLTENICKKYRPAKQLKEDCHQVEVDVENLKTNVQEKLAELEDQVSLELICTERYPGT